MGDLLDGGGHNFTQYLPYLDSTEVPTPSAKDVKKGAFPLLRLGRHIVLSLINKHLRRHVDFPTLRFFENYWTVSKIHLELMCWHQMQHCLKISAISENFFFFVTKGQMLFSVQVGSGSEVLYKYL